jgi:hypothetical protein
MAYVSFEVIPVNGQSPEYFDHLREVVEYLREQAYENFYIQITTDYDYERVVEKVQDQIWNVFMLDNVEDIS